MPEARDIIPMAGKVLGVNMNKQGKARATIGYAYGQGPISHPIGPERFKTLEAELNAGNEVAVELGVRIVTRNEVVSIPGKDPFAGSNLGAEVVGVKYGKAA